MLITPIVGLADFAVSWSFSAEAAGAADAVGSVAPLLRFPSSSAPVAVSAASPPIASSAQSSGMGFRSVLRQKERVRRLRSQKEGFGRRVGFSLHGCQRSTRAWATTACPIRYHCSSARRGCFFSSCGQGRASQRAKAKQKKKQRNEQRPEARAGWRNGGTAGTPRSGQTVSMEQRAGVCPVLIRAVRILCVCWREGVWDGWVFAALSVRSASFKFWVCRRTKRPSHQTDGLLQ